MSVKAIWKAERNEGTYFEPDREALAKFKENAFQGFMSLGQSELLTSSRKRKLDLLTPNKGIKHRKMSDDTKQMIP